MTAPTLVLAARGSSDHRVERTVRALMGEIRTIHPAMDVRVAFLDSTLPTLAQSLDVLDAEGVREAVVVPLDVTHAIDTDPRFSAVVERSNRGARTLRAVVSRPLGPESSLLTVLDQRLRAALAVARVLELDGLVLSAPSSGDVRGAALLARRARQWSTHHRLPCLTAVADGSGPSVAQSLQGLRSQGRRHLAVGSFFLTRDERFAVHAEQARRAGAVAVSDPLGACEDVAQLVLARYAFGAMELLAFDAEGHYTSDDVSFQAMPASAFAVGA